MWIFINMLKMMLAVSSICSWEIVHLKILQSNWPRAFWLISGNNIFPKYRIYGWAQQIIKNFIIEQIQWKLMNKFFFKFKETYFRPPPKKTFYKIGLPCTTSSGFLGNSEKTSHPVPRKLPDTCQEGRMDRPYLIGSFQLPPGVYQEQLLECDVDLTKNYCITVSTQKISSIQKLIYSLMY